MIEGIIGGLLVYDGDSDQASLNPALNLAVLLSFYSPLASSQDKSETYASYAASQLNYALGSNPMSCPYVVGSSPNSPQNPHSALSSGGSDINNIDTDPPQEAYVLYGAVVGGPDRHDRFYDIRSDWPQTEPALDLNAPLLTLAALVSRLIDVGPSCRHLSDTIFFPIHAACDERFVRSVLHKSRARCVPGSQAFRHSLRCRVPLRRRSQRWREDRYRSCLYCRRPWGCW